MAHRLLHRLFALMLPALVLGAALCGTAGALARTVLDLDSSDQPVLLKDWGDAWIDPTGVLPVERVVAEPTVAWSPTASDAVYPLKLGRALWVRFTIPPAPDNERWYLEVPSASVDRATLFTMDSAGRWVPQTAGDRVATSQWPVPHRHPLLPLEVTAEEPRTYLLRLENPHNLSAPLAFISDSHLARREQRTSLILGIYFGLAALAAVVSVLSAATLRDPAFGWYALTVTLMGLSQAAITGIAGLHLWPSAPHWNDASKMVLTVLAAGALGGFVSALVSLPERSKRLQSLLAPASLLSVVVAGTLLFGSPSWRLPLFVMYIALALAASLGVAIWAARRGDRYAGWVLATMAPLLLGAAFPMGRALGLLPTSFWTLHGMQIGTALELPALLVILMLRSQQRRENRRRIQGLDRIDPATGLVNAHVFEERLAHLIARSQRLRHRSLILLVDLTNVDHIRRTFDRRAAEELPLRVAARLLAVAREIDTVARLSEHRFGLLLEGPLKAEEVAEAGPKVVAHCLMPFSGKPLEWVAQARVAQASIPMDGQDAHELVARLDALLANVSPGDRRAVFPLGKSVSA